MEEIKLIAKNFANLLKVKSLVTFALVGTLSALALKQNIEIPSELFASAIASVLTYFFAKSPTSEISANSEQNKGE